MGKTSLRQFIRLMHHAAGVVCPVTFAMHLAAAVETRAGAPKVRPCVVIAGGREPTHWEAYPQHQYLSTVGALSCCLEGGCWKSRCQLVGDGDEKDRRNVCEQPVQLTPDLRIPRCLDMITADDVIRRIELYLAGVHDQPIATERTSRPASAVVPGGAVSRTTAATNGHRPVVAAPRPVAQRAPVVPKGVPASPRKQRVLIQFRHGLGDAVQLTIVLRHLRQAHPDWEIELSALRGKHSVGQYLCDRVSVLETAGRRPTGAQQVYALDWDECHDAHAHWPSTKPTRCLREVFHLEPNLDLFRYQIARSAAADQRAREYLATLCPEGPLPDGRYPVVLLHYQGNTSCDRKDLPHDVAKRVCETARDLGYVPVILDWDRRSPLIDQRTVFCPEANHSLWGGHGTGDAEALAALIEAAALMIGIDSGPLHVAGATTTPTLGVWTRHHPVHFFDLCPNVRHLVPRNHPALAKGTAAVEFFQGHYEHDLYDDLAADLVAQVRSRLTGQPLQRPAAGAAAPARPLTATQYDRQYYEEHQRAGLDYLNFGDWQQRYGRWFVESLGLKGKRVLDVGCACGSILRGLGEAGAVVEGIDLCEHMIQLGRQKWPDMAPLLHVADAADLARYGHSSWEALHSAQVAEHWSPEAVPRILTELARITVPGGLFFCSLDTEELFARQNRNMATEDPTHICIQPRAWWIEQLAQAGWTDVTAEYVPALLAHGDSFLQKYDWDYFIARKAPQSLPEGPYDLSAYPPRIWDWTPASLDRRHLFWLFDVLAAGRFQHALEIGCLNGASSTAFVEALNRYLLQRATFCDIDLRDALRSVLSQARNPERVQTYPGKSIDLLRESTETFDFVFVDGDHRLENVRQETELLIQRQTPCVMAHDTNVQSFGYDDCDGTPYLKWRFQTTAPYYCLEDNAARPGEDTGRGLFFATTSLALFESARASLGTWGQISIPVGLPPPAS